MNVRFKKLRVMMSDKTVKTQRALMISCLISKYCEEDIVGGSCHVILEDGNYKDSDVVFCLKLSKENNDFFAEMICILLSEFSIEERELIIERYWEIEKKLKN